MLYYNLNYTKDKSRFVSYTNADWWNPIYRQQLISKWLFMIEDLTIF